MHRADPATERRNRKIITFYIRHPKITRKGIAFRYYISYDLAKKILIKIDRRKHPR